MSICGVDGGIAPIAPGPLSSIKDTIKYDLSVIIIETTVLNKKEKSGDKSGNKSEDKKPKELRMSKHEMYIPNTIRINTFIHPITREQMIEII
jgi:hypothetical protein